MRLIVLEGSGWTKPLDFYRALLDALGPMSLHGLSLMAFCDSMIGGGMLEAEPPYTVSARGVLDPAVRAEVDALACALARARRWRREHWGEDVDVSLRRD